jgi:hypothetical protein
MRAELAIVAGVGSAVTSRIGFDSLDDVSCERQVADRMLLFRIGEV